MDIHEILQQLIEDNQLLHSKLDTILALLSSSSTSPPSTATQLSSTILPATDFGASSSSFSNAPEAPVYLNLLQEDQHDNNDIVGIDTFAIINLFGNKLQTFHNKSIEDILDFQKQGIHVTERRCISHVMKGIRRKIYPNILEHKNSPTLEAEFQEIGRKFETIFSHPQMLIQGAVDRSRFTALFRRNFHACVRHAEKKINPNLFSPRKLRNENHHHHLQEDSTLVDDSLHASGDDDDGEAVEQNETHLLENEVSSLQDNNNNNNRGVKRKCSENIEEE